MSSIIRRYPSTLLLVCALSGLFFSGCVNESDLNKVADRAAAGLPTTDEPGACDSSSSCCGQCQSEPGHSLVSLNDPAGNENRNGDLASAGEPAGTEVRGGVANQQEQESHANSVHEDRDIFHYLLRNHKKIKRTVKELENGVQTVTESDDPAITAKLQEHVASMHQRIETGRPLRMWDDLFREIFRHHDKIKMEFENTKKGVSVKETSDDPHVARLIKEHARVVSQFTSRGFAEARENHPVPTAARGKSKEVPDQSK